MIPVQQLDRPSFTVLERGAALAKPRILYLITRAERGGAQMHVLDLMLGMKDGFELHVATGEQILAVNTASRCMCYRIWSARLNFYPTCRPFMNSDG